MAWSQRHSHSLSRDHQLLQQGHSPDGWQPPAGAELLEAVSRFGSGTRHREWNVESECQSACGCCGAALRASHSVGRKRRRAWSDRSAEAGMPAGEEPSDLRLSAKGAVCERRPERVDELDLFLVFDRELLALRRAT